MPRSRKAHNNKKKHNKSSKASPTIQIKPLCSPANPNNGAHKDTCYTPEALIKMKTLWNTRHKDDKITSNNAHEIWSELRNRFAGVCDTEKCWLRQTFVSNKLDHDIMNYTFAPDAPNSWDKNPNEWLTSTDLSVVMKHFEKQFKQFAFIGPSPIDFDTQLMYGDCVWEELCKFSVTRMIKRRKRKIGIVFNTDPHTEDGEHWISMFVDLSMKDPYIFFFDSNGDPVPTEIMVLTNRIIEQGKDLGMNIKFYQNHPLEHQKGDTECGMYSLYMIIELLTERKTYEYFMKERVSDKDVERFRHVYFNRQID
jgi:hypothetical protein